MDLAISTCKKNNCQPLFVYIPNSQFWRPDSRSLTYLHLLKNYVEVQYKMKFIDTTDDIMMFGKDSYSIEGPHLSPLGYKLVADKIYDELELGR